MKIALHNTKVSELFEGYGDKVEEGVRGDGDNRNILLDLVVRPG